MGENMTSISKKKKNKANEFLALFVAVIPLIGFALFQLVPMGLVFSTMFVDMMGFNLETFRFFVLVHLLSKEKLSSFLILLSNCTN